MKREVLPSMTNFEKLKDELTQDKFIDMIPLNWDKCPAMHECGYILECCETLEK